jgi:hypothetical protein
MPDVISCGSADPQDTTPLPINPFLSPSYHFGMLLGVDDFETIDAYHRGKMWLHSAWLHRAGAVWGLGVKLDTARGEVQVAPGLAVDGAGHELHLEAEACVNVGQWFDLHQNDAGFTVTTVTGGGITDGRRFDAHVVARFKPCLTRQVPALAEPCEGSGQSTAFSRVFETIELLLLPNRATPVPAPYHRLRLLFGLDQSTGSSADADVIAARDAARTPADWLAAFRRFAALDEVDLVPATDPDGTAVLFPDLDSTGILLADITGITLDRRNDAWVLLGGTVDNTVRPTHVPTTTIQELLSGVAGELPDVPATAGPRIDASTVQISDTEIRFRADSGLNPASVTAEAIVISTFAAAGWKLVSVNTAAYDDAAHTVTATPSAALPAGVLVRLIVRGTGPTPILGANGSPLAGAVGGPPSPGPEGRDFVFMQQRS